jgi:hypothetical protein
MRTRLPFLAAALLTAAVLPATAGCSTPGYERSNTTARSIRDASGSFDRLHESGEAMLAALNALLGQPRDNLPAKFAEFSGGVDRVVSAESAVRSALDGMRGDADGRFAAWEQELGQYQNAEIRGRSESRLREVRATFEAAASKADAVREPAAALAADAQDLRRLLANDLTSAGIDVAADAAKKLRFAQGRVEKAATPAKQALSEAADALSTAPPPPPAPSPEPAAAK